MGSKQYNFYLQQLEQALARQRQPTQLENTLSGDWGRKRAWLQKGDLKSGQDIGAFTNLSPIAGQYQENQYASPYGDTSASGAQGSQYANKLMNAGNTSKMWGGAYEDTAAGVQGQNNVLLEQLQGLYNNRMQKGIEGAQTLLQAHYQKPKSGWSKFFSSL